MNEIIAGFNEDIEEIVSDVEIKILGALGIDDDRTIDKSDFSRYDYCVNIGIGSFDIHCPEAYQFNFSEYYQEDDDSHTTYLDTVRKYMRKDCEIVPGTRGYGVSDKVGLRCPDN